jgi:iron(III) transport system permease protein
MDRVVLGWAATGVIAYALLPWYAIEDGIFGLGWLSRYPTDRAVSPALVQALFHGRLFLLPLVLFLLAPLAIRTAKGVAARSALLLTVGTSGLAWVAIQGFAVGSQPGIGVGGFVVVTALLMLFCVGLAARGAFNGDRFVSGGIGAVIALVVVFVFYPVSRVLVSAIEDSTGAFAPRDFWTKLSGREVWGLDCLHSSAGCGVAWNTLLLGVLVGASTTALGLAFALIVTRTGFRAKKALRVLTVLPIITPPFVIGLAVILLFGRAGVVTTFMEWAFGVVPSRWIYGLPGIWLAQVLAFTPIAFLVLIGVVEGISPSMEEAAQTLRADRWRTFTTVSLPLMRPGLANAFLLGFIESLADFGNPLVLGGNFHVLSISIFFAVVGAQHDRSRAAVLSIVLLVFTLGAFYAQRRWLGRRSYATVTGKGDSGLHPPLPASVRRLVYATALPWAVFTAVIYSMILLGGFVETWGRDHRVSLRHYVAAFAVDVTEFGVHWKGAAWNSFWTTLEIAAISAPLTAAVGLLTAYLLVRQRFRGREAFEFGAMLSFAIPGTVIGISYILAFNTPPIELTGTGIILVICFVFRNMPVGVRAGIAAMSQIDRSLDEASLTLGARSLTTVRRVILPLLRPAIVAALVFSFVRAMTAISAVIFLVSANYDMATSYIVGRVENGDYGLAIAYCSVLIVFMVLVVLLIQLVVGRRRLGRRAQTSVSLEGIPA